METKIVLVASVSIIRENKVLMIKENKEYAKNLWNFPSGRLEYGEGILDAAVREAKEETGYDVRLTEATGVYNFFGSSNHQVILFHFIGEIVGGTLQLEETGIIDSKWIEISDLLIPELYQLRNRKVIEHIAENLLAEKKYPLESFCHHLLR
ncbi:NUDIX hydrolase [Paenibacillus chitinolyticus]|uniref:NUDIX hydrolase n=1 Tax=Paenibacillus chitinolyticus TaxID=79263 RepID=UPI003865C825